MATQKPNTILILHDIRSVINVGALFRTADAIGINQIIISGVTPSPIDRFGRVRADFAKSALGAEHSVPWIQVGDIIQKIQELRSSGYTICSIEQSQKSIDYKDFNVPPNINLVVIPGNEVSGVSEDILNLANVILEIPMNGSKESLNVSVATGIVLYRLLDK